MGTTRRDPRNTLSPPGEGAKGVNPRKTSESGTGWGGRKAPSAPDAARKPIPGIQSDTFGGLPPEGRVGGVPTRKSAERVSERVPSERDVSGQKPVATGWGPGAGSKGKEANVKKA